MKNVHPLRFRQILIGIVVCDGDFCDFLVFVECIKVSGPGDYVARYFGNRNRKCLYVMEDLLCL